MALGDRPRDGEVVHVLAEDGHLHLYAPALFDAYFRRLDRMKRIRAAQAGHVDPASVVAEPQVDAAVDLDLLYEISRELAVTRRRQLEAIG
jgi:hypothetical protein